MRHRRGLPDWVRTYQLLFAWVLLLGGVAFAIIMFAHGNGYFVAETRGEWIRMDIVAPNAYFGSIFLGVVAMLHAFTGLEIRKAVKREVAR